MYLIYCFKNFLRLIKRQKGINILTFFSMATSLLILSIFLLVFQAMEVKITTLLTDSPLFIFLKDDLTQPEKENLINFLNSDAGVKEVKFISSAKAKSIVSQRIKGLDSIWQDLQFDLPTSIQITLKKEIFFNQNSKGTDLKSKLIRTLEKLPTVSEVIYGESEVKQLQQTLGQIKMVGLALGSVIVLSIIFIIINTIGLMISTQGEKIAIQTLVGATHSFVRIPFIFLSLFLGSASSVFSLGILKLVHYLLLENGGLHLWDSFLYGTFLWNSPFLPVELIVSVLVVGLGSGVTGGYLATRQYLK